VALACAWCAAGLGAQEAVDLPTAPMLRLNAEMHTAMIKRIAVDREQTLLATASDDKTVRLWDLREGRAGELRRVLRLPGDEGNVGMAYAVALSPDGATVAVGGFTGRYSGQHSIYFHDTATGRLRQRLGGLPQVILHLAWSPDGRWLVACLGAGHGIRVYDVAAFAGKPGEAAGGTGSRSATTGATEVFADADYGDFESYWADFHPGGRTFATICWDGKVRLYRVPGGLYRLPGGKGSPGGRFTRIAAVPAPGGERPFSVAHSPDGRFLAVGYAETTRVDVLHAADLRPAYQPDTAGIGNLSTVAWSPGPVGDGPARLLAAGRDDDGTGISPVIVWEDAGHGVRSAWPGTPNTIYQLLPLRQGRVLLASGDPAWKLLDPAGNLLLERTSETGDFRGLREGERQLRLSRDGTVVRHTWDELGDRHFAFDATKGAFTEEKNESRAVTDPSILRVEDWLNTTTPTLDGTPLPLEREEISRSLAIAPDGTGFLLGTEWQLHAFNQKGAVRWKTDAPGAAWSVNVSGDGRFAVAAFGDGTIRWYRYADGTPLLNFFPRKTPSQPTTTNPQPNPDWILWAPEGWFASSAQDAESLMGWQINRGLDQAPDFYGGNQIREVFLDQHGILKRVLQECRPAGEIAAELVKDGTLQGQHKLEEALAAIPEVELREAPADLGTSPLRTVDLVVRARAGHPDRKLLDDIGIQLRIDGVPQKGNRVKAAGDGWYERRFTGIELKPGRNVIDAEAQNDWLLRSAPETRRVYYDGPQAVSRLWILGVGVEKYAVVNDLLHCQNDVRASAEALRLRGRALYAPEAEGVPQFVFLPDAEATRDKLDAAFAALGKQVGLQDTFVFLYAGHGGMGDAAGLKPDEPFREEFYLVTHDATAGMGPHLAEKGVGKSQLIEWLTRIQARRKMIVLDACYSGDFVSDPALLAHVQTTRSSSPAERALYELYRATGTAILTSTEGDAVARSESALSFDPADLPKDAQAARERGFGFFTYTFLEGLLLGKANRDGNAEITVRELDTYIFGRLPELARKHNRPEQRPVSIPPRQDYPLGMVE
jgi:WD40 repeat protein/uncharacterized caspase-like protein